MPPVRPRQLPISQASFKELNLQTDASLKYMGRRKVAVEEPSRRLIFLGADAACCPIVQTSTLIILVESSVASLRVNLLTGLHLDVEEAHRLRLPAARKGNVLMRSPWHPRLG